VSERPSPAFRTVALDVDSTISGVEGIDWLAERRGADVARRIGELTDRAMRGDLPLERVYGLRLATIRPRRDEVEALAKAYVQGLAPGCAGTVSRLRDAGVTVVLISGGLRNAMLRLATHLGVKVADVHAVQVQFDAAGEYSAFDESSPLATSIGKRTVIAALRAARPILMVGDGMTDLAARPAVDSFAAFTGFASREPVVAGADMIVHSFDELGHVVLG
jgi:phosphoserine phosphatase